MADPLVPVNAERALPNRTVDNERFWDSCQAHRLELQRCCECARFRYYPAPVCPQCSSTVFEWMPVSGRGELHSFSWVHRPAPGFASHVPYAYALVQLDEGPILATNIVDSPEVAVRIGARVEICYEDVTAEVTLPLFRVERGA